MNSKVLMACLISACGTASVYAADSSPSVMYVGAGSAKTGSATVSDATPMSIGFILDGKERDSVVGFDIAREGTLLDSTWRRTNAVSDGYSFNLLFGRNLTRTENSRIDVALLVGFRKETQSCPRSYLGYQCYADLEPDEGYAFNYGAVLAWTYRNVMVGVRGTGESKQVLIGVKL